MAPTLKARFLSIYMYTTYVTLTAVFIFAVAEAYVRWKINQNFSFLPGSGFEALVALAIAELLGIAYLLKD